MTRPVPQVDFKKIDFPTDKLTLKALRAAFSNEFAGRSDDHLRYVLEDIRVIMSLERRFAETAFRTALDKRAVQNATRKSYLEDDGLGQAYISYGIAKGLNHAEQLLRDVEAQATAQASKWKAAGGRNF